MMKKLYKISLLFLCSLIFSLAAEAQNTEWIRVQSDNGEFSIEAPAEYGFFYDQDGFSISDSGNDYFLREMRMLNAYHEQTLLSIEIYKAGKNALNTIRERDNRSGKFFDLKVDDYKIKQVVYETKDSYAVKKYFNSKNHIYILTAASRKGETPAMKRFFDSMIFNPNGKITQPATTAAVLFSNLRQTPVEIVTKPEKPADDKSTKMDPLENDADISKLIIISKPLASYTNAARAELEQGRVRMRVTFAKEGRISKLLLLQTLQKGLLRQSVFAALRIKFLPQEKAGEPQTVTKLIEYTFSIY